MATKELTANGKPGDLQHKAMTMSLAILVERIHNLPADDRNDLYELMKEIRTAETKEDLDDVAVGMLEILDNEPVTTQAVECPENVEPGLQSWLTYVSDRIRNLRTSARMTQADLATKSGLPQSHISRLESGKHSPSRATLEKIAKALSVDLSLLDPSE